MGVNKRAVPVIGKHPIATPMGLAARVGHLAAQAQIEIQKDTIDLEQLDQWLGKIRACSIALVNIVGVQEAEQTNGHMQG